MLLVVRTMTAFQSASSALRAGLCLSLLLLGPFLGAMPPPQKTAEPREQASALPATTGEPLTVKPVDRPDLACTIMEWDTSAAVPALKLLCPPDEVFAPLRVYLKLSWQRESELPPEHRHIVARAGTRTLLRTGKDAAMVRLEVVSENGAPKRQWISFTGVVDVALITRE